MGILDSKGKSLNCAVSSIERCKTGIQFLAGISYLSTLSVHIKISQEYLQLIKN